MDDLVAGLLSIGAFSRASLLSVRTLRKYHDTKLFVPAHVDPVTGYRSYHASQLTDAGIIRRLRELEVPLADVGRILEARNPSVTREILAAHAGAMQDRFERIGTIVATLQTDVDRPQTRTPVHVRREPPRHSLAVRGEVREAEFGSFLGDAYPTLHAWAHRLGVEPTGPDGALYPGEIIDDGPVDVEAFTPIAALPESSTALAEGSGDVVVSQIPAAEVAVIVHEGSYDSIGDTYRLLGDWVAYNATPAPAPIREVYLVSYGESGDPARFRTEIQWPLVEPR